MNRLFLSISLIIIMSQLVWSELTGGNSVLTLDPPASTVHLDVYNGETHLVARGLNFGLTANGPDDNIVAPPAPPTFMTPYLYFWKTDYPQIGSNGVLGSDYRLEDSGAETWTLVVNIPGMLTDPITIGFDGTVFFGSGLLSIDGPGLSDIDLIGDYTTDKLTIVNGVYTISFISSVAAFRYNGGTGDVDNPFQIATLSQLQRLSQQMDDWNKSFVLTADIDASATHNWNVGDHDSDVLTVNKAMGFSPIGNSTVSFSGVFDGTGHRVKNLYIDQVGFEDVGLFGNCNGADISRVILESTVINGKLNVGGVVGLCNSSNLTECYVSGTITGESTSGGIVGFNSVSNILSCHSIASILVSGSYGGGLSGKNFGSTIISCLATGNVSATDYAGGLSGYNQSSEIDNSCSKGAVIVTAQHAGGLVGYQTSGAIKNCYAIGEVNGSTMVGGLVGSSADSSSVESCYASGVVTGINGSGGLIGDNLNSTVVDCYWDNETTGQLMSSGSDAVFGLVHTQFLTFDFSTVWSFGNLDETPWLDTGSVAQPNLYWEYPVFNDVPTTNILENVNTTFNLSVDNDLKNQFVYSLIGTVPEGFILNSITGNISWCPTEVQDGSYQLSVIVSNGVLIDSQSITIIVNEVNEPPVIKSMLSRVIDEEELLAFTVTVTDIDLPQNSLLFNMLSGPEGASIDSETGEFSWTPSEFQAGFYVLTLQVFDGSATSQEDFMVLVKDVNEIPALIEVGDKVVYEEEELRFTVVGLDSDFPVQTLTYAMENAPEGASINVTTGEFLWTPNKNQDGDYLVIIQVSDGELTGSEEITITVNDVNELPVAQVDIATTTVETPVPIDVLFNDSDVDSSDLTVMQVENGSNGIVTISESGVIYTPNKDFVGTDIFSYTVSDGKGSDQSTVTVSVIEVENCLRFDDIASDDVVTVGTISEFEGLSAFTIELWVKNSSNHNIATQETLFSYKTDGADHLTLSTGSNLFEKDQLWLTIVSDGVEIVVKTVDSITIDQWHHVAILFDGTRSDVSENVKMFINGVSEKLIVTLVDNAMPETISSTQGTLIFGGDGFDGSIDEFRLWSLAREESSIRRNVYRELDLDNDSVGLLVYYDFDIMRGDLLIDQSVNSINGVLSSSFMGRTENCWMSSKAIYPNSDETYLDAKKYVVGDFITSTTVESGAHISIDEFLANGENISFMPADMISGITTNHERRRRLNSNWFMTNNSAAITCNVTFSMLNDSLDVSEPMRVVLLYSSDNQEYTKVQSQSLGARTDEVKFNDIPLEEGFYTLGSLPIVPPGVGVTFTQDGVNLSWFMNDEFGVLYYQIVDVKTGTVISEYNSGERDYSVELLKDVAVQLVVIDKSGFRQTYTPADSTIVNVVYDLTAGWNLIAMPGDNSDVSALKTVIVGEMWGWNGTLYELVEQPTVGDGIWVYTSQGSQVIVSADRVETELELSVGWNMVGPVVNTRIPEAAVAVYGWNEMYKQVLAEYSTLLQGVGYWIFVNND